VSVSALSPDRARTLALEAGFSDAGVVALPHAAAERDARRFEEWVQAGRAGTMGYLERRAETGDLTRARVETPFPWAHSAIVCFVRYDSPQPRSTDSAPEGAGWIARYAWSSRRNEKGVRRPSDYHKVLLKRLKALEARLHAEFGDFEARAYVDTGPVVERSLATAAGLGWTAKNTCLIHPKLGSFGFLAVLLTALPVQLPVQETKPLTETKTLTVVPDRCGTCRRCIDACPTGALTGPYRMDARLCISYLTIEHKGPIEPELMQGMGRQVFGCDICQDVCPWNAKSLRVAPISIGAEPDPELATRAELVNPALEWLATMDEKEFEAHFNGSPVRRAGFNGLRRNVAIAMGNSGLSRFAARLEQWAEEADEGVRNAARWALGRLERER
jgi:epoxyqueuosine reductase